MKRINFPYYWVAIAQPSPFEGETKGEAAR